VTVVKSCWAAKHTTLSYSIATQTGGADREPRSRRPTTPPSGAGDKTSREVLPISRRIAGGRSARCDFIKLVHTAVAMNLGECVANVVR
jgi:hypothetical protein